MDPFYKVKVKDLSDNQKRLIDTFVCNGECDSCPLSSITGLFGCLFIDIEDTDQDFEVPFIRVDGAEQIYVK